MICVTIGWCRYSIFVHLLPKLWIIKLTFCLTTCYNFISLIVITIPGGERNVIELLENESRKLLSKPLVEVASENPINHKQGSLRNFFFRPRILGKDLLTIEKFGLVQYVSRFFVSFCFILLGCVWLWYLLIGPDDSEDILCLLSILVGAFWCLWWWGV